MHSLELSLFEWMIKINYEVWFTGLLVQGKTNLGQYPPEQNHQVNVASLRCAIFVHDGRFAPVEKGKIGFTSWGICPSRAI